MKRNNIRQKPPGWAAFFAFTIVIANLMMGGNGSNVSDMTLDEITLSAISEAMNQMCGTIAESMSTL